MTERQAWMIVRRSAEGTRGREAAEEALLAIYKPLSKLLARKVRSTVPSYTLQDIESCALIGLLKAIRAFDPEKGVKFFTFAHRKIMGEMLEGLRVEVNSYTWQVPGRKLLESVVECRDALGAKLGRPANVHDIAEETGIEERIVNACFNSKAVMRVSEFTEGLSVTLHSEDFKSPESIVTRRGILCIDGEAYLLSELTGGVNKRHVLAFTLVYIDDKTHGEAGKIMGVSATRVNQLLDLFRYAVRRRILELKTSRGL